MPHKNRLYHAVWLFYFCALPWFKAFASVAEVALIVATLATGSFFNLKHTVLRYKWVSALALILLPLLWGMFYTEDLHNGWRIVKHQHRFLVIPLIFLANADWLREHFRKYLFVYTCATTLACCFIILLYLLPEATVRNLASNATNLMLPYPENVSRTAYGLYSPFIDRLQFSSITAAAILSGIYLFITGHYRRILLAAFPILFFTMLILGARGAQLALFISLLVLAMSLILFYAGPYLKQKWGRVAVTLLPVACLLVFLAAPYLAYKTVPAIQHRVAQTQWEIELLHNGQYKQHDYVNFTTLRRLVSWENMWEVVKQNPLLGVGTGDYHPEIKAAYAKNNPEMEVNTHSQYLLFWAMSGIFGLLIFLGVCGYWLLSLRKSGLLYLFGLAFLVFYLVVLLPDSGLSTQVDGMVFCTFMALIGLQKHASERKLYA